MKPTTASFRPHDACTWQTLIDVFYSPLVRWVEQHKDSHPIGDGAITRTGPCCYPSAVSRAEVEAVFLNVDKLIVFSRFVRSLRRIS